MDSRETLDTINQLSQKRIPFLFIINYEANNNRVIPLDAIDPGEILYSVNGVTNQKEFQNATSTELTQFTKTPISFEEYKDSFNKVMNHLRRGDSYLTNLTCSTPIACNLSLREIFLRSSAKYKLFVKDAFVVFSPEIFIQIKEGTIFSYPMKGTIDGTIENAEQILLSNKKEAAEHATIVDLIRNDLSKVASGVTVDKYRYIDRIKTNEGELLQVSSVIRGLVTDEYQKNLGTLLFELLPAGSISGAPKVSTLKIIASSETHKRGFYTGVFGLFDGRDLDCGVMIRFIENQEGQLVFKSGGGITADSSVESEYGEMIQKVYLPF